MQTRKYPRTLNEAFGPHTSKHITEEQDPMPTCDKIILVTCSLGIAALVVFLILGWV
jgi:hypothetical protein